MKAVRYTFVVVVFVCAFVAVANTADAKSQALDTSIPREFVNNPCGSQGALFVDAHNAPDGLICPGPDKAPAPAAINIPVPLIEDKEPELSIVEIPTYFSLTWDTGSFAYTDSARRTYEWVDGIGTRNRLVGLRVQMRINPVKIDARMGNVYVFTDNQRLVVGFEGEKEGAGKFTEENCNPGWSSTEKSLLTVTELWGGWVISDSKPEEERSNTVCLNIKKGLEINNDPLELPGEASNEYSIEGRYQNWVGGSLEGYPRIFGAVSEYASIDGGGSVNGSPAYQIDISTYVTVEARVIWDKHQVYEQEKHTSVSCEWEYYYSGYDFIDMGNWPNPVYCKYVYTYTWTWKDKCALGECLNEYGLPPVKEWWTQVKDQSGHSFFYGNTVLYDDGYGWRYEDALELVVIQAQPLLTAP